MGLDLCYMLLCYKMCGQDILSNLPQNIKTLLLWTKLWCHFCWNTELTQFSSWFAWSSDSVLFLPATIMLTIKRLVRLQPLISLPASWSAQSLQRLHHLLISHHKPHTLPPTQSTLYTRPWQWSLQDKTDKDSQNMWWLQHHCSFSIIVLIVVWPLENSNTDHLDHLHVIESCPDGWMAVWELVLSTLLSLCPLVSTVSVCWEALRAGSWNRWMTPIHFRLHFLSLAEV